MKMNDLKKKLMMKFSRIEYKHVQLPNEYVELSNRYKTLKKDMSKIVTGINGLLNYEHNGSTMKKINHSLSVISTTSKLGGYSDDDVFKYMEHVTKLFDDGGSLKNLARGYKGISEQKAKFNEQCKKELDLIVEMKKKTDGIDRERDNVKVCAYDLEVCKQSASQEREEHDRFEELYYKAIDQACALMQDFLGENGIDGILRRVHEYNLQFFRNSVDTLERTSQ